jgi:hypothetical protein
VIDEPTADCIRAIAAVGFFYTFKKWLRDFSSLDAKTETDSPTLETIPFTTKY